MEIRDVSKRYNHTGTVALENINLQIQEGVIHGLLGNNGAGKTTLIKCIMNLLIPDSGEIYYRKTNIIKDKRKRIEYISVLLDGGRNLYLYMTVKENFKYFSMLHGIADYTRTEKYAMILKHLDIDSIIDQRISNLSFGMRQRVAIATALLCDVEFLILDEPTTGLDIHFQENLSNLLIELKEKFKLTILVSSHDMEFIKRTCSYCTLLEGGKIIKSGKIEEFLNVFENESYTLHYEGSTRDEDLKSLKKAFDNISIDVENRELHILWEKERNLVDLFQRLDERNIFIKDIEKNNDLTQSILLLTKRGESQ